MHESHSLPLSRTIGKDNRKGVILSALRPLGFCSQPAAETRQKRQLVQLETNDLRLALPNRDCKSTNLQPLGCGTVKTSYIGWTWQPVQRSSTSEFLKVYRHSSFLAYMEQSYLRIN